MGRKIRQQVNKGKKKGFTPVDILMMREIARKEAEKMEGEIAEKAFLYMLAIPLNVLVSDYWPKSAKKKAPKFIEEVMKLFDVVMEGLVSDEELYDLLKDMAGVDIQAEWLKRRENEHEGEQH